MGQSWCGVALAEDGKVLCTCVSPSEAMVKYDLAVMTGWRFTEYTEHYPQGYDLVWVSTQEIMRADFRAALDKRKARPL